MGGGTQCSQNFETNWCRLSESLHSKIVRTHFCVLSAENWVCAQWKTRICRLSNKAQQINLTYKKHIWTLKFRDKKSTKDYKGHALRHCKHFQYGRPGFDSHVRRVFTLKMSVIFYLLHKLADDFLKRPDFFFRFYDQDQSKNNKISVRIFKISSSPSPRGEF